MSFGNNSCDFSGRLTREAELRYTPSGSAVCDFSIAVNSSYKNNDGEAVEKVTYVNFVAWGKIAEHVAENYTKGTWIDVSGSEMVVDTWDDKTTGEKRTSTKYKLRRTPTSFLGGKVGNGDEEVEETPKVVKSSKVKTTGRSKVAAPAAKQFESSGDDEDDDNSIPF